jgi:hypothetical protein
MSVSNNPACPDQAAAERAVNEVWESCFNDTRPFDEVCFDSLLLLDQLMQMIHIIDLLTVDQLE